MQFGEVREDWYKLYNDMLRADGEAGRARWSASSHRPIPRPAAPLASYVGTYANDYWGPARVTEKDGRLQLALGPKLDVPLDHWDGNVFTFSLVSENSPPGTISKATFDGDKLTLEYYDTLGKGTFTR